MRYISLKASVLIQACTGELRPGRSLNLGDGPCRQIAQPAGRGICRGRTGRSATCSVCGSATEAAPRCRT